MKSTIVVPFFSFLSHFSFDWYRNTGCHINWTVTKKKLMKKQNAREKIDRNSLIEPNANANWCQSSKTRNTNRIQTKVKETNEYRKTVGVFVWHFCGRSMCQSKIIDFWWRRRISYTLLTIRNEWTNQYETCVATKWRRRPSSVRASERLPPSPHYSLHLTS